MNYIVSFLYDNIITISISAIIVIAMLAKWFFSRNKTDIRRIGIEKWHQLSNKEYKTFCENSKKSIENSTVSFGLVSCSDKNEIDDLYSRTLVVGSRLLRDEKFQITAVRKV